MKKKTEGARWFRRQHRHGRTALAIIMGQQDVHILNRGDQVVLNLLSPEPPPAGAFEVMIVGGIGKTLLHQLLPAFAISQPIHDAAP